jgi:hypothetical protein
LLQLSRGETPPVLGDRREGVRTHLAMQALLGCASKGGTRRDLLRECRRLLTGAAFYADSTEELTPVVSDWISAVPLLMTAMLLFASANLAGKLARGGFGAHPLDLASVRRIESDDFR